MEKLRSFLEVQIFGVCTYLGEKLSMPSSKIRLFFIYATFVTAGSPVILYLVLAFLIKMKDYIKGKRNTVWDV
ncbi:MAG TPA: PspC domain-containing protein [Chitinophagales bacterium]|nr:PspC domain-containing protein [Chitinophagales bacterium]